MPPPPPPPPPLLKPFWRTELKEVYARVPFPIAPSEGWDGYKKHRQYGSLDLADNHDQVRRITRGEVFEGPSLLPGLRKMMDFAAEKCFSKLSLPNTKYIFARTCLVKTNPKQRWLINHWIRGSRQIYNATLASIQNKEMPLNMSPLIAAFATANRKRQPAAPTPSTRPVRVRKISSADSPFLSGANYYSVLEDACGMEDEGTGGDAGGEVPAVGDTDNKAGCVAPQYPTGHLLGVHPHLEKIPSSIRRNAVLDVLKGFQSMHAKVQKGGRPGIIHPRRAARGNIAIVTPSKSEGYSSFKMTDVLPPTGDRRKKTHIDLDLGHGLGPLRVRQKLPESILQHNIVLHRSRRGKFYIRYFLEKSVRSLPALPPAESRPVTGLDPGVKSFITRFDAESGAHVQYGTDKLDGLVAKSRDLVRKVVQLKKQLATNVTKEQRFLTRRSLKKLEDRKEKALERVQGFKDNLHKQTAADLCAVKRTILLPPLPVSKMVQRVNPETGKPRKLWGKTAQKMLNLCHFKFREFLKHKVVMTGCELVIVTEEFTSMTCGACGHLNRTLGAKDVFKCTAGECVSNGHTEEQERMGDEYFLAQCGFSHGDHLTDCSYVSSRDESAARNIVLLQLKRDT